MIFHVLLTKHDFSFLTIFASTTWEPQYLAESCLPVAIKLKVTGHIV